jgi:hypothetical protein
LTNQPLKDVYNLTPVAYELVLCHTLYQKHWQLAELAALGGIGNDPLSKRNK